MDERRITSTFPDQLVPILHQLGADLAAARKVRGMSQAEMSQRINISRKTVGAMEKGDPRVGIGAYAVAAWVMGLEKNLTKMFDQREDPVFQREARLGLRQRVTAPKSVSDMGDLDF